MGKYPSAISAVHREADVSTQRGEDWGGGRGVNGATVTCMALLENSEGFRWRREQQLASQRGGHATRGVHENGDMQ